jgi:hypothetical protein
MITMLGFLYLQKQSLLNHIASSYKLPFYYPQLAYPPYSNHLK